QEGRRGQTAELALRAGAVGDIHRRGEALQRHRAAQKLRRIGGHGRRDLGGDDELAAAQLRLQFARCAPLGTHGPAILALGIRPTPAHGAKRQYVLYCRYFPVITSFTRSPFSCAWREMSRSKSVALMMPSPKSSWINSLIVVPSTFTSS